MIRIKEEGAEGAGMEGGGPEQGGLIVGGCRLWVMTVCAPSADSMVILHGSAHHNAYHRNGYDRI